MDRDDGVYPLSFKIGGQKYDIRTSEDREVILNAAAQADRMVGEYMKSRVTYQQALVLTVLEYARCAAEAKNESEGYRVQIGDYLKDAFDAKLECERLKRDNERLRKQLISKN